MIKTRDDKRLDENTLVLNVLSHAVDQAKPLEIQLRRRRMRQVLFRIIPTILYVRTRLRTNKRKEALTSPGHGGTVLR